jgi:hypothetical protein
MKQLNVRLPDELHAALKTIADAERRSLNAEIVILLERAVEQAPRLTR